MNYANLKTTVYSFADRQDAEILAVFDIFLQMVEARINRWLLTQKMSVISYTPIVAGQTRYALPSDFLAVRSVRVVLQSDYTRGIPLSYCNPEQLACDMTANIDTNGYAIVSDALQIWPVPTTDYSLEIDYFRKVPPLTSVANSNWLLDAHPDAYVFGCMAEINAFVKDATATQLWDARFKEVLTEIEDLHQKSQWSGNPLTIKLGQ